MREVATFGGTALMVNEKLLVSAHKDGSPLVRVAAERHDELSQEPGASPAVMGADRPMGPGWISVTKASITSDDRRQFFLRNLLDLAVLFLPVLRPLRLLRLVTLLSVLNRTGSNGLWSAITMLTTVGYGDTYPVSVSGRLVAAVLMVAGIALLGIVTATLASWLVERVSETAGAEQAATRSQVADLAEQVRGMRRDLAALATTRPVEAARGTLDG